MPRSPSASAHQKVLDAAMELIAEEGIESTSMDAIARRSGVSKATMYKHWANKDALVLEVMAQVTGLNRRPKFDSGNTRADLVAVLAYMPPEHSGQREKIFPHFMAYAAHHEEIGMAWRNMVMDPPRRELTHLLKLGISKREITPDLDIDLSLSLLLGPGLYRYIFLKKAKQDPGRLAEGVVDAFWRAFSLEKPASTDKGRGSRA